MQRFQQQGSSQDRPRPVHASQSFTRYGADSATPSSPGSHPLASPTTPSTNYEFAPEDESSTPNASQSDIFETHEEEDATASEAPDPGDGPTEGFEDLPIEIQSLIERFLESISAKAPAPLPIDRLSELYQNFYVSVESHIATHIAALSTRINRDVSPAPSTSSRSSGRSRGSGRRVQKPGGASADVSPAPQQRMLTASEITGRKKARRALELKRVALEEAVERSVCERAYNVLWKHRGTDDAERDEKLRSRTAALSVVGVDLQELLSTALSSGADDSSTAKLPEAVRDKTHPARNGLKDAKESLEAMTEENYPLGKLRHLTVAHKYIVETLSAIFPSTSSADEILPTLIYTIITMSSQDFNLTSNFNFIQRFRSANKVDGEAAYCLTNLEAAISFLETVDLSSLRPHESAASTDKEQTHSSSVGQDPMYRGFLGASPELKGQTPPSEKPVAQRHSRRLSSLLNRPKSLEAASDVVMNSADTAFDAIHGALDGSFKFLFGRIKEQQATQSPVLGSETAPPKTLEDARILVNSPRLDSDVDDAEERSITGTTSKTEEGLNVLGLIGGKRAIKTQVIDAPASVDGVEKQRLASPASAQTGTVASPGYAAVESMRTFGNSLNPLRGFSMRSFGRTSPLPGSGPSPPPASVRPTSQSEEIKEERTLDVTGIGPPIERFLGVPEARELNGFDVELLLRDYQRIAGALRALQQS